jgi:hypothetical protein
MSRQAPRRCYRWLAATLALASWLGAAPGCARPAAELAGQWQLSWQGRIGTEQALLWLQPSGQALKGSVRSSRASARLSGAVHGAQVSFAVELPGPPPYRIVFSGSAHGNQIGGQAQPQDLSGRAFAGHGGEVSAQYYSWTAVRLAR